MKPCYFERAIFISWYCSKRDCKFCYLSSKTNPQNPKKDRRSINSILAEVYLCKKLNWKIEFLSGGLESYTTEELLFLLKKIKKIYGKKLWLNIGILPEDYLKSLLPYIDGICGTIETINPKLNKAICPSKPIQETEKFLKLADKYKLKKTITIILGLGETIDDFKLLKQFIKKHKLDKITFYRLKPQKDTSFENTRPISKEYYLEWVKKTRIEFPKLHITVGSWLTHLDELENLLKYADNFTKFPAIKKFNSKYAHTIEQSAKNAKRILKSKLTGKINLKIPNVSYKKELEQYQK